MGSAGAYAHSSELLPLVCTPQCCCAFACALHGTSVVPLISARRAFAEQGGCYAAEEEYEQIEKGQLKGQAKGRVSVEGDEPGKLD